MIRHQNGYKPDFIKIPVHLSSLFTRTIFLACSLIVKSFGLLVILTLIFSACKPEKEKRFVLLSAAETGIDFINELHPTAELNIFNYLYFYDGAGVAAGDLNGNGYPDLYFTSNQGKNQLYINKGDFKFENVTETVFPDKENFWSTGVTMADINGNGRLDIYISNIGGYMHFDGHNQLFINLGTDENGIPVFEEKAAEYGLDFEGLSTQAAFLDYDMDGKPDLYLMNHSVHEFGTLAQVSLREEFHPLAGDRLFRNEGGKFVDVTEQAGIYSSALGYGLGIAVGDITQNGYPDIYIGNDFHEDDYLYINNGDGTFTESLEQMIRYTSYSSMGNELVDITNNSLLDIFSLDMLPEDYVKRQTAAEEDPLEIYNLKRSYGYKHKFSRNTLQLNRGNGKFSEIGMLAGVHATDWSWATLGADFNNNGYTDLFVSNGIKGRTNDLDYFYFITQDEIQRRLRGNLTQEDLRLAERAPAIKIPNYIFKNNGTLFFEDVSEKWGVSQPTFSSGAIYVDLNNDGDLDLVINNVNQPASVFRNMTREKFPDSNYLKIYFNGPETNRYGIGSRITIPLTNDEVMMRELYLSRGFQSSVEPVLHVGLGSLDFIPELHVRWPDGKTAVLEHLRANQTITIHHADAQDPAETDLLLSDRSSESLAPWRFFEEITAQLNIPYKHEENNFIEFNREPLIPHMVSREGPALAIGDVNGNGLEDFFVGGARRQKGYLFLQQEDGTFVEQEVPAFEEDSGYEDVDAHFADFTGDGSPDLLVVSGGNEYTGMSEYMLPRLYTNDSQGNFTRKPNRLPDIYLTGSVAAIADVNGSGHPDIFIGARAVPWNYGKRPTSYLLINRGDGYFDVDSTEFGTRFSDLGMVTGAEWADMNSDGSPDLVVASEWENLKIVYNQTGKGVFEIPGSSGLWNTVSLADLNRNGRPDILAGNLGLNSKFKASGTAPLRMYVNDFDGNGTTEQIVTYIDKEGKERLFARKDELGEQMPYIFERFDSYRAFAEADLYDVIDRRRLHNALTYTVHDLHSAVFYNYSDGFSKEALPVTCQFSPIHDFLIRDLNQNSIPDVISVGNFYEANIQRGRYDGDYGNVLINDGKGDLRHIPNRDIDWYLEGQIRRLDVIHIGRSPVMIVAENDRPMRFFRIHPVH